MIYHSNIFEDVKSSLNIRDVITHYGVNVNRAGKFLCPFHNEKTASASIRGDYFNCFGCGAGGDLIKFTALLFELSNIEACKKLVADFGLNIQIGQPQDMRSRLEADRRAVEYRNAKKRQKEIAELVTYTGGVLADWHRYLWGAKTSLPVEHPRHLLALRKLDYIQYQCECFDSSPEEYSIQNRKAVVDLERELHGLINKDKRFS